MTIKRSKKMEQTEEFARVVQFEKDLQKASAQTQLKNTPYLHSERVPIDQVKFEPGKRYATFGNECAGVCGV